LAPASRRGAARVHALSARTHRLCGGSAGTRGCAQGHALGENLRTWRRSAAEPDAQGFGACVAARGKLVADTADRRVDWSKCSLVSGLALRLGDETRRFSAEVDMQSGVELSRRQLLKIGGISNVAACCPACGLKQAVGCFLPPGFAGICITLMTRPVLSKRICAFTSASLTDGQALREH